MDFLGLLFSVQIKTRHQADQHDRHFRSCQPGRILSSISFQLKETYISTENGAWVFCAFHQSLGENKLKSQEF